MHFHTDDLGTMGRLRLALAKADKIRFSVDGQGRLKYKVGEGMWSEPIASTPDSYRDRPILVEKGVWRHTDGTECLSYPDSRDWTYTTETITCWNHSKTLVMEKR